MASYFLVLVVWGCTTVASIISECLLPKIFSSVEPRGSKRKFWFQSGSREKRMHVEWGVRNTDPVVLHELHKCFCTELFYSMQKHWEEHCWSCHKLLDKPLLHLLGEFCKVPAKISMTLKSIKLQNGGDHHWSRHLICTFSSYSSNLSLLACLY